MRRITVAALSVLALTILGTAALAGMPEVPPTPSAHLGIAVEVTPVAGAPGQFAVSSVITDLENKAVVAKPSLQISAGRPGRIQMGVEDEWMIIIDVSADAASHKATYDATFMRDGKEVSRQQVSVSLQG